MVSERLSSTILGNTHSIGWYWKFPDSEGFFHTVLGSTGYSLSGTVLESPSLMIFKSGGRCGVMENMMARTFLMKDCKVKQFVGVEFRLP